MRTAKIYKNKANLYVTITENQRFNSWPSTIMPYGQGWQYNLNIEVDEERYPNGQVQNACYATSFRISKKMSLNDMINAFIRCKYTIDEEFAIQRQRDTKPEKFKKYSEEIDQIISICEELFKKF